MPPTLQPDPRLFYPESIEMGEFTAYRCQPPFYMIKYTKVDGKTGGKGVYVGSGSEEILELMLPYDHSIVRMEYMKPDAVSSHAVQLTYTPKEVPLSHYIDIYKNATLTEMNAYKEVGDQYEGLAGAVLRWVLNVTASERVFPIVYVKFLNPPKKV